jgi:hypothetical protein
LEFRPSDQRWDATKPEEGPLKKEGLTISSATAVAAVLERYPRDDKDSPRGKERELKEGLGSSIDLLLVQRTAFREALRQSPSDPLALEARYRLALVSIRLYELRRNDEHRREALADSDSYLEIAPESEERRSVLSALGRAGLR